MKLFAVYLKGHCSLTSGDCIRYIIAYYADLIVRNKNMTPNIISDRGNGRVAVSSPVQAKLWRLVKKNTLS